MRMRMTPKILAKLELHILPSRLPSALSSGLRRCMSRPRWSSTGGLSTSPLSAYSSASRLCPAWRCGMNTIAELLRFTDGDVSDKAFKRFSA